MGGIRYDLNDSTIKQANDLISYLRPKLDEYFDVISQDEIFIKRTKNIGVISKN